MSKLKRIIILLLIFVVAIIIFFQIKENFLLKQFNLNVFIVKSGSMNPILEIGDMIIVKKFDQYSEGDIITFKENKSFITHRIVRIQDNKYITKGDYNNTEDLELVEYENVVGKVIKISKNYFNIFKIVSIVYLLVVLIYLLLKINLLNKKSISFIKCFEKKKIFNFIIGRRIFIIKMFCVCTIIILIFYSSGTIGKYNNEINGNCNTEIAQPIIDVIYPENKLLDKGYNTTDIYIRNYKYNEITNQNDINKVKMLCKIKIKYFYQGEEVNWGTLIRLYLDDKLHSGKEYEFEIDTNEMKEYHLNIGVIYIDSSKKLKYYAELTFEQLS